MCLRRVEAPGVVEPFLVKGAQARTCWSCWIGARPHGIFEFFIDSASQLLEARELVLAQVEHLAVGAVRRRVTPAFSYLLPVRALIVFNELSFHTLEFFLVVHVGSLLDMVDVRRYVAAVSVGSARRRQQPRLLNRRGCFPKFDLFIEQTRDVWKDMLDIRKRFEPRAGELARKYALADYTMFIGSGALWGETILYSMCLLEEMQWKRIRHITSHDFFHGTLELLEPGVPVFLFMGEDECRALDERVRAFLTSGVTGDEDYVIIDTAEYAIPGLDDDFRVIVSPWILSVLTTDRLARNYELVTKHNLKYRRHYHQFDY